MKIDAQIEKKLINNIGQKRCLHSVRVYETAIILGDIHNMDLEKIKLAAILHDCGKIKDRTNLLKMAFKFDIMLDNVMMHNIELIHGPLGAKIAEKEYGVKDPEVLNAIRYHTTGRKNMTMLDKIIYISDYIEPGRTFSGVDEVRKITFKDINAGLLLAIENTIKLLMKKNRLIHVDTIKARNDLRILLELI